MNIALVTDAWSPQVNGVVTTLVELVRELGRDGHEVTVVHPGLFRTRPCPGYAGIDLAIRPGPALSRTLDAHRFDAIHIATEGPLGWAARRYCLRRGLAFTTAYHTRFPELLKAAIGLPLVLGYALFRHFHRPSSGVMVPTQAVLELLQQRGFRRLRRWTHGVDTAAFTYFSEAVDNPLLGRLARPVALFVGRVSYEKNIEAFLQLDWPGTKVVCGVGPLLDNLRDRYPQVRWVGLLPRDVLAQVYGSADVFVFPSRHETFGLVMLEALSSGTPVAAYPGDGPEEVLGQAASGLPQAQGVAEPLRAGVLHDDLRVAALAALSVPREQARQRAQQFSWRQATDAFVGLLVPLRAPAAPAEALASQGHRPLAGQVERGASRIGAESRASGR